MCPGLEKLERLAAREIPAAERADLDAHLADCEPCRTALREIETSLAIAARLAGRAPDVPGPDGAAAPTHTLSSVVWPERETAIGPFRILDTLGEGGFGVVYLAEQTAPVRRRVAVKVIKPGMDSARVIARFEAERQALAMMDHPNIAKVLDAGTTETGARPYFVMEHVPGESITSYADRHKLSTRDRIELFIPVCEAVQHAHTKGIIHRDLKPSNVLVVVRQGAHPVPKVIDFGVAKALHGPLGERTIFTEQGQLIGTPEYMSPEQAEMGPLDIDTRSDVYSLGVMLYELLAGARPFDLRGSSLINMVQILREQAPMRPSTRLTSSGEAAARIAELRRTRPEALSRELKRELEWIPLKALKKDRTERYQTAADLGRDLRNYLEGLPLIAGPETASYRLRKFVRRNRGPVAAAAAVVAALALGLVGTVWQARRANDRAEAARIAEREQIRLRVEADRRAKEAEDARHAEANAKATIEYNSYVANVEMAAAWMSLRRFDQVRERLDACPERLRGWEWRWLHASSDASLIELKGKRGEIASATFSADGARILTTSSPGSARVWDAATGKPLAAWEGPYAAFSPDGTRIATWWFGGPLQVRDTATGQVLAELKNTSEVDSATFNRDGTRIVTTSFEHTARVWDALTGNAFTELTGHTNAVRAASFSPDGKRIVTASWDETARVWDAVTGNTLAELAGHKGALSSASYSPDGLRIVTASLDRSARVWDALTYEPLAELRHGDSVATAAFSPDCRCIVTSSEDGTARAWITETGRPLAGLSALGEVRSVAFSPDGSRIVTASWGDAARVWDALMPELVVELRGHTRWLLSSAFSPEGARIVTASGDRTARVWDALTGQCFAEFRGHASEVMSAAFDVSGTRVVTASKDKSARVWDAVTGRPLMELVGHLDWVRSAVFSPDGARIVTASDDTTARVWDAETGRPILELAGHKGPVRCAAFSSDGARVVTASRDATARVVDATTGQTVANLIGHTGPLNTAAFSLDGACIVTASEDTTARVWNALTGEPLVELRGHDISVSSAVFSPDGARIVTASADKTARVWDAATGKALAELRRHTNMVISAAFSPDGSRIVTASTDGTARVWDSLPYRERFPAVQHSREASAKIAPLIRDRLQIGTSIEDVRNGVLSDSALSSAERTAALSELFREVSRRRETAYRLNSATWNIVVFDPVALAVAARAVADARRAVELAPDDELILNTLGVALYRAGEYAESLEVLARSEPANAKGNSGPQPADWAFIAMAHWQLGHSEPAREALVKLRELAALAWWKDDAETKAWLREAEQLIDTAP